MKRKIPFGATIAHAYRFTFANFLNIALLIWVPLAISFLLGGLLLERINSLLTAIQANDPSAWSQLAPFVPVYFLGMGLAFVQFTAVSEFALGMRQPALFSFPLGKPVWRLMGAVFLGLLALLLILIALGLLAIILGIALGFIAAVSFPTAASAVAGLTTALAILIVEGAISYTAFRLFFLLVPVTLVLQRIDLYESWRLTKGNFWRIFGIWLALFVPLAVVEYSLIFAAIGLPATLPPDASQQAQFQAQLSWNIAIFRAMVKYWYVSLPFAAAAAIFLYGVIGGAQAFAYRALTDEPSDAVPG
jgi:hypothetical protein